MREFRSHSIPAESNLFDELLSSVRFDDVTKGRQGGVLVKPDASQGVPIVRTTTKYGVAAQCFRQVHVRLAQQIQQKASLPSEFNNALIENYSNDYATMGAHSDQALDLQDNTHIAIFSCYKYPDLATIPRKLVARSKQTSGQTVELPLLHNTAVVFSLATNRQFKHKIVLDRSGHVPENQWLGITYRTSKTFVRLRGQQAFFEDGTLLTLATDDEAREFYRLRGRENRETDFTYPSISFTISESDILAPEPA